MRELRHAESGEPLQRGRADSPHLRDGQVVAQVRFFGGLDHIQAVRLGPPGGELGHQLGAADSHADGDAQLPLHPSAQRMPGSDRSGPVGRADVEKGLLDRAGLHSVGGRVEDVEEGIAHLLHLRAGHVDQDQVGALVQGILHQRPRAHPARPRWIVCAGDVDMRHNGDGTADELGSGAQRDRCEKSVGVHVQHGACGRTRFRHVENSTRVRMFAPEPEQPRRPAPRVDGNPHRSAHRAPRPKGGPLLLVQRPLALAKVGQSWWGQPIRLGLRSRRVRKWVIRTTPTAARASAPVSQSSSTPASFSAVAGLPPYISWRMPSTA
jgi:hypothetical protein